MTAVDSSATEFFINVNDVCNERCVFCAANLADGPRRSGRRSLPVPEIARWLDRWPQHAGDRVLLAGGEPTLHKQFLEIVELSARRSCDVRVFTNGLRLADRSFTAEMLRAGATRIEVALFGSTPETHDVVTRSPGSFRHTMKGLQTLLSARGESPVAVEIRLLAAKQCVAEAPAIVKLIMRDLPDVDSISINRLILSSDAAAADALVDWAACRRPINDAARLIVEGGYELVFESIPYCVFEEDNASFIRQRILEAAKDGRVVWTRQYLDPRIEASGWTFDGFARSITRPCSHCDYISTCRGVERWYVERFGEDALHPVSLGLDSG